MEPPLSKQPKMLNPNIVAFSERELQEFHDFTLSCGQPMRTVLVSERVKCRKCDKPLVLEKTYHAPNFKLN